MVICIKQHLSKILNSIHEKVTQQLKLSWKKSVAYKKRMYVNNARKETSIFCRLPFF